MTRRGRRSSKNLPQDPVELTIDRISHEGRGIASINGKVAFVDGGLPGERVMARYLNTRSRFDEMAVVEVLEPSDCRVEPKCAYFGICGGCSLQHLSSDAQIAFKQDLLFDQFCHAAGLNEQDFVKLEIQRGQVFQYRRKARLAVRYVAKKGGVLVGFREKHSTFITVMDTCQVLVKEIAELIEPLRELIGSLEARQVIPQFEVAAGENLAGKQTVALVMRHLEPLDASDLGKLCEFARRAGCEFYLQPKGMDSIHKLWPETGPDRLQYTLPGSDITMRFHPTDFVQVNESINRKAVSLAIELLELECEDQVLDLFCGLGNFTLPLSRHCREVIGVEGSVEMVNRAQENAAFNKITNVKFDTANLYALTGQEFWFADKFDKILLDPPRSGALEIIDWIGNSGAKKIVYISCNPATLARDAARLLTKGYKLNRAGVMDMFPHTAHVESIAEFELRDA